MKQTASQNHYFSFCFSTYVFRKLSVILIWELEFYCNTMTTWQPQRLLPNQQNRSFLMLSRHRYLRLCSRHEPCLVAAPLLSSHWNPNSSSRPSSDFTPFRSNLSHSSEFWERLLPMLLIWFLLCTVLCFWFPMKSTFSFCWTSLELWSLSASNSLSPVTCT